jgi:Cys-tRNA(Pro)/Cys-tRNA(Cys) deacylase
MESLTGYIRDGVTALHGKKEYPVYADKAIEYARSFKYEPGFVDAYLDCLRATKPNVAPITRSMSSQ